MHFDLYLKRLIEDISYFDTVLACYKGESMCSSASLKPTFFLNEYLEKNYELGV